MEKIASSTVPVERNVSEAFDRLEVGRVWHKVWQVACRVQDIPDPGDATVYDVAGMSAVLVRQSDGSIKAFHNSCLHRGTRLCDRGGALSSIRCRFRDFTWGSMGSANTFLVSAEDEVDRPVRPVSARGAERSQAGIRVKQIHDVVDGATIDRVTVAVEEQGHLDRGIGSCRAPHVRSLLRVSPGCRDRARRLPARIVEYRSLDMR